MQKKFQAIIFDLDDTLLETSKLLTLPAFRSAIQVMRSEGLSLSEEEVFQLRKESLRKYSREKFLQYLAHYFVAESKQERCLSHGLKAFHKTLSNQPLHIPKLTYELLNELSTKYHLYLVTSGEAENQKKKVEQLEITGFFKHIFFVDISREEKKRESFLTIINKNNYEPTNTLCVGNRLDIEIEEAKSIGLKTCHILQGEFKSLTPQNDFQIPDYTIQKIQEIKEICPI